MYASTEAYVAGFFLVKEAINKWVEPKISEWIVVKKLLTIAIVCLFVGVGFLLDGVIISLTLCYNCVEVAKCESNSTDEAFTLKM